MVAGNYEFILTDDQGIPLSPVTPVSFSASKILNDTGVLRATFNPLDFPRDIERDWMIQVWRQPPGLQKKLFQTYLMMRWEWSMDDGGSERLDITGYEPKCLLWRRIVKAYAGSTQAEKTDYADDMMKDVMSEALSDATAPVPSGGTRSWTTYFSIEGDTRSAPSVTLSFAWKQLLTQTGGGVMGKIADASAEAGVLLFFDVYPIPLRNSIEFEFRTRVNQYGQDLTNKGVMFSREIGNLGNPYLLYDYSDEANYVYAGGKGSETDRVVTESYDTSRLSESIWALSEKFKDARSAEDAAVQDAGNIELEQSRPIIRFGGDPRDSDYARFGKDWDFGDRVKVGYGNLQSEQIIKTVVLSMDEDGQETIRAAFDDFG